MVACLPAGYAQAFLRQQVALNLRSQVEVSLERGSLLWTEVVEAVLHQRIGEQAVSLYRVMTFQA